MEMDKFLLSPSLQDLLTNQHIRQNTPDLRIKGSRDPGSKGPSEIVRQIYYIETIFHGNSLEP